MTKIIPVLAASFLLMLSWATPAYAEDAPSQSTGETQTDTTTATSAGSSTETAAAEPDAASQAPAQDTLGGAGLKDRKLSVIFEQFVPSETISADNAVPFPIDI